MELTFFRGMKRLARSLLLPWLLHFMAVWFITVGYTVIAYVYKVNLYGPYLRYADGSPVSTWQYFTGHLFRYDVLVLAFALLLAEINYHFLFKKVSRVLFIGSSLGFATVAFAALAAGHIDYLQTYGIASGTGPILFMALYALLYALVRDYFYQYNHRKDLHLQQSQNELDALKAQLNPHFLFNSLNYLYGTALREGAEQTAEGIDTLSDLLRYTISGMRQNFVPLSGEIHFIQNYLALQQARLPNKGSIRIQTHIKVSETDFLIAPMLLLTFIENAFKYGISIDEPCFIDLKIEVRNGWLIFQVTNSIVDPGNHLRGSHTGLATTRKRLDLLYPDNYELELNSKDGHYTALLKLHLHTPKP